MIHEFFIGYLHLSTVLPASRQAQKQAGAVTGAAGVCLAVGGWRLPESLTAFFDILDNTCKLYSASISTKAAAMAADAVTATELEVATELLSAIIIDADVDVRDTDHVDDAERVVEYLSSLQHCHQCPMSMYRTLVMHSIAF